MKLYPSTIVLSQRRKLKRALRVAISEELKKKFDDAIFAELNKRAGHGKGKL